MALYSRFNNQKASIEFFLTQPTSSVSLRQQGSRQTGRAQRPQPESTPDWDPARAGEAYWHRTIERFQLSLLAKSLASYLATLCNNI